jgi:hypothetical protein
MLLLDKQSDPANPPQTEHPDSLELEVFFLFLCLFKTSEGVW